MCATAAAAAVEYTIRGRADSEEFARAERLGRTLERALPSVRVETVAVHPSEWHPTATDAAVVEIVSGGGVELHGFEAFRKSVEHKYGSGVADAASAPEPLFAAIAAENLRDAARVRQTILDEAEAAEERANAARGTAMREWALCLGRQIETDHVPHTARLASDLRRAKAKAKGLAEVCASIKEAQAAEEARQYDQQFQQQQGEEGAAAAPVDEEEERQKKVEAATRGLLAAMRFQKAVEACAAFPVDAVKAVVAGIQAGAGQLARVDPLWQISAHWTAWHGVAASSFDYLGTQCAEGEGVRARLLAECAAMQTTLAPDGSPQQAAPPCLIALPLAERLVELAAECASSAAHLHKAVAAEARVLRTEDFLKVV